MASRVALWGSIALPAAYVVLSRVFSPIPEVLKSDVFDRFDLAVPPPATYSDPRPDVIFNRLNPPKIDGATPDTTAVILNWARLPNVLSLVALLCDPSLEDIIAEIVVWNNSPEPIWHRHFQSAKCPRPKLRIVNSRENLRFQARFMACARASTKYCFLQDDDYLVRPEVIRALHMRAHASGAPASLYVLPSHEHLSTSLRITYSPAVHTSFAWLGHGALIRRTQASEFLQLMHTVGAGVGEFMMADNYFSVLANVPPEVWFDQGVELSHEAPFTDGEEGRIRNEKHITKATEYLEGVVACDTTICGTLPYVYREALPPTQQIVRSAVRGSPHILETNIRILPKYLNHLGQSATDMLRIGKENLDALGEDDVERYQNHPLSAAVDGDPNTAFHSYSNGRTGDYIAFDLGGPTSPHAELAFLIAHDSFPCLIASSYESSEDGTIWTRHHASWRCDEVPADRGSRMEERYECSVSLAHPGKRPGARHVRVWLGDDVPPKWVVYEIWMREREKVDIEADVEDA